MFGSCRDRIHIPTPDRHAGSVTSATSSLSQLALSTSPIAKAFGLSGGEGLGIETRVGEIVIPRAAVSKMRPPFAVRRNATAAIVALFQPKILPGGVTGDLG
jgi:hypothetical protein